MLEWLSANWGTILVTTVLAMVVAGIVLSMRKRKQGEGPCTGDCCHCAVNCASKEKRHGV